ncbi:uncharacterized protein LOC135467363 [Liolophura sinensis]|uniref:uncharacterized protein LOC135467363 n=1 Tax=Liolophura sinensis TaxID=3198878 RepID=UPI0031592664
MTETSKLLDKMCNAVVYNVRSPADGKFRDVKIVQDGNKTYVIAVKDNKHVAQAESGGMKSICMKKENEDTGVTISQGRLELNERTRDRVKRNLANIGDESEDEDIYTSSSELAEVFGVTSKLPETQTKSGLVLCPKLCYQKDKWIKSASKSPEVTYQTSGCIRKDVNVIDAKTSVKRPTLGRNITFSPNDLTGTNVALNRKLFASPSCGSDASTVIGFSNKTPVSSGSQNKCTITPDFVRHAYKTPTPELPEKLGAVRKIFVVQESPSFPKSSTPNQKCSRKTANSPKVLLTSGNTSCTTPLITYSSVPVTNKVDTLGTSSPATQIHITIQANSDSQGPVQASTSQKVTSDIKGEKSVNLDDSLTNIQWLGGLASEGLVPKSKPGAIPTGKEIERVSLECGRHKRPAYSYMMLIRMAMNSREDKKMTLREICKWIEDTFPFYKYTAKPGWRNSIRHNLSVYDIFVRVPSNPKQHGSHWTVKDSNSKKMKYSKSSQAKDTLASQDNYNQSLTTHVLSSVPLFNAASLGLTQLNIPGQSCNQPAAQSGHLKKKEKKGPTPILPRPPVSLPLMRNPGGTLQAYALIPISSLGGALPSTTSQLSMIPGANQPVPIPQPMDTGVILNQAQGYQGNEQLSSAVNTGVVPCSPEVVASEERKVDTCNVIKEAWNTAGCMDVETTLLQESTGDEQPSKRTKVKPGLPKPKMYSKSKSKRKKSGKSNRTVQKNSTPVKDSGIITESQLDNDIENGLPTPLRQLLDTPAAEPTASSTPLKSMADSPKWLSPIAGLTPGRLGGLCNGSFLDCLPANFDCDSPTIVTPVKSLEAWLKIANGLLDTPNASLLQINSADLSPLHGGGDIDCQTKDNPQSISHLLAEIDPCLVDELDNSQFNLSSLNWANPFQST